jgi:hypothetical protein
MTGEVVPDVKKTEVIKLQKKPPTLQDVMRQLKTITNTIRKDRDGTKTKLSELRKQVNSMMITVKKELASREIDSRDKTLEVIKERARVESERLCKAILEAKQKSDLPTSSDGALAAINLLAVESLFLLDRRVRTERGGKRVGLREALCAVEDFTSARMKDINKEIYKKTGPEGHALIAAFHKATVHQEVGNETVVP